MNLFEMKSRKKYLFPLVFFTMFFSALAHGFINIEEVRRKSGSGLGVVGKTNMNLGGQEGNSQKFGGSASTLNIYEHSNSEYLFLLDYKLGVSSGKTDTNNGQMHFRYTLEPKNEFSWEFFVQFEFDQFRQLINRDLFGLNLRQRLIRTKSQSLYLGYGSFYELNEYEISSTHFWRANIYLSYVNQLVKQVSSYLTVYYQPAWDELSNYRFQLQTGVSSEILSNLSLNIQISSATESHPQKNVKPTDFIYSSGLTLSY